MTLQAQLKEHEIKISKPEPGRTYSINCPKSFCQKEREGSKDPADKTPLKVEILDAHHAKWKCDFCLWSDKVGELPTEPVAQVEPVASWEDFFISRGISASEVKASRAKWDEEKQAIAIPTHVSGKTVAITYYRLDGSSWYVSKKPALYNIGHVQAGSPIVIAQNELDAMLLMSCGIQNVVGLPNGGGR